MVVIGGSGTGKSVLLKCILGLVHHDGGTIRLDGQDVTRAERDPFLARFGMLFQGGALFDSLRVWENVAFRLMRGASARPKAEAREIAVEKLRRVGLGPQVADLFPAELSGGMQKRVGLARAIAAEPEIIFFDEPTTGLDPIMAGVINDLIREIVVEMGATAMTITHDMSSVRAIADQVAMLHAGRIQWTAPWPKWTRPQTLTSSSSSTAGRMARLRRCDERGLSDPPLHPLADHVVAADDAADDDHSVGRLRRGRARAGQPAAVALGGSDGGLAVPAGAVRNAAAGAVVGRGQHPGWLGLVGYWARHVWVNRPTPVWVHAVVITHLVAIAVGAAVALVRAWAATG